MKSLCNICKKTIIRISKINHLNESSNFSWESDSTFNILNLKSTEVFLGFCNYCFQTTIYPKFNTDLIYNDKSYAVRKRYFEKINPGKIYGKKDKNIIKKNLYKMTSNELIRLKKITDLLSNTIVGENKDYSILDYGGGNGFVSQSISKVLNGISNLNSSVDLFDLMQWKKAKIKTDLNKKYDLIILAHVLEHVHEPKKIINECKELLAPNGIIYCEIPDERLNIIKSLYKKFGLHYHVTHHTRRSVHILFAKTGFNFIHTKYNLNSSYQGIRMSVISCIASNNKNLIKSFHKLPSKKYELISFFNRIIFYIIKKIFLRTDRLLEPRN